MDRNPSLQPDRSVIAKQLESCLDRLISEWTQAMQALGLAKTSTWTEIAECLELDRGTAQRLVRIARISHPTASS
ncbi:MAG: hypothetical protein AAGB34_07770, partial [Planctomycetota bacterium]